MFNCALFFNPKKEKNIRFFAFAFAPKQEKEIPKGHLFLVGKIKGLKKRGQEVLKKIGFLIQQEYYQEQKSSFEGFQDGIQKANLYIQKIQKKQVLEINFLAASVDENLNLKISFLGKEFRFLLIRENEMFDFDLSKINFISSIQFSSIIEGSLEENDKVLILNNDLFLNFWEQKFFSRFKKIKTKKELKKFLKRNKNTLKNFYGVFFFSFIKKEKRKFYLPFLRIIKKEKLKKFLEDFSSRAFSRNPILQQTFPKVVVSVIILSLILLLGYYIFH